MVVCADPLDDEAVPVLLKPEVVESELVLLLADDTVPARV